MEKHFYTKVESMFLKMLVLPMLMGWGLLSMNSCSDEPDLANYYTFTGEMVSDYLQNRQETYSDFIQVLQRAKMLDLLAGYGKYTCFAPTNSAFNTWMKENGYSSVSDIPTAICDTLAWTHLIRTAAYFTTDLEEGSVPTKNMDDRFLVLSCDSDATNNNKLIYYINKSSQLVHYDDSVENGVVHTLDRVISSSNLYLPDLMEKDSTISLFISALQATGLKDSLRAYIDESYSCNDRDSTELGIEYSSDGINKMMGLYQKVRKYGFTAFVEPNSVYKRYGIETLDDLKAYAKQIYDATYPEDAGLYDDNLTHRKNPLNRFVAYHLLDRMGNYNDWNVTGKFKDFQETSVRDVQDFFETMCPYTIIKISSPAAGMFINRKGVGYQADIRGCRVLPPSESTIEQSALNGVYHYIDDILVYDVATKDIVFNTRFRIDASTLSPDFMNSGGRGRDESNPFTLLYKSNAVKHFSFSRETKFALSARHHWWNSWEGDDIIVLGKYDVTFKLPPVPEGTYELRLGYVAGHKGTIQIYFNNVPCGIPLEMSSYSKPGYIADTGDAEADKANDKAMHNRGYMKGPDSYKIGGGETNLRSAGHIFRRILTTQTFGKEQDNYLRVRLVLDNENAEWSFDYIELCPKSVYDGPEGEDIH